MDIRQLCRFEQWKNGLFKKAYSLHKLFSANVAVVINYPHSSKYYVFRSKNENWPPSIETIQKNYKLVNRLPWDFQTTREALEESRLSSPARDETDSDEAKDETPK
ncbi:MAG: hypothetical protein M1813_002802 [Trichoglossum hirsutum]|nr:MAG: hypothetical protein M1813_002802 [Trichoglossum hirsutum]